jgi:hypothetical protein
MRRVNLHFSAQSTRPRRPLFRLRAGKGPPSCPLGPGLRKNAAMYDSFDTTLAPNYENV